MFKQLGMRTQRQTRFLFLPLSRLLHFTHSFLFHQKTKQNKNKKNKNSPKHSPNFHFLRTSQPQEATSLQGFAPFLLSLFSPFFLPPFLLSSFLPFPFFLSSFLPSLFHSQESFSDYFQKLPVEALSFPLFSTFFEKKIRPGSKARKMQPTTATSVEKKASTPPAVREQRSIEVHFFPFFFFFFFFVELFSFSIFFLQAPTKEVKKELPIHKVPDGLNCVNLKNDVIFCLSFAKIHHQRH